MKKIIATLLLIALLIVGVRTILAERTVNTDHSSMTVAASYYPLYDFAKNIGGEKTQVSNMTPASVEPHDYEPSARTLAEAGEAKLFIYNGLLEPWTSAFVQGYRHTTVKASQGLALQTVPDEHHPRENVSDPHFWLDPVLAGQVVDAINHGLRRADPTHQEVYDKNATGYKAKLTALDADFRKGLANCNNRTIVTSHAAFGYMGKRYRLHVVPIAGLSPEAEPSPAKLAEISRLVKDHNIGYIYFESLVSPRLAQTIARETGAKTLALDPIEGLSEDAQKQGKNYISVQRENLKNLRLGLGCR